MRKKFLRTVLVFRNRTVSRVFWISGILSFSPDTLRWRLSSMNWYFLFAVENFGSRRRLQSAYSISSHFYFMFFARGSLRPMVFRYAASGIGLGTRLGARLGFSRTRSSPGNCAAATRPPPATRRSPPPGRRRGLSGCLSGSSRLHPFCGRAILGAPVSKPELVV